MLLTYCISDLLSYINWAYFFHAWSIPPRFGGIVNVHGCDSCRRGWVETFSEKDRGQAREALSLYLDAQRELSLLSSHVSVCCAVELYPACSHEDDILVFPSSSDEPFVLPMLRQQTPGDDGFCLSLSDFLRDEGETKDKIGIFASSVNEEPPPVSASKSVRPNVGQSQSADAYHALMRQTLKDRLAEAGAERLHEVVRKKIWGYSPDENLTMDELHAEHYQGIRPAVGYPCLPDVSLNFLLSRLINFDAVGISLTEHGMMMPHASVSGLMISSADAHYFSVGHVQDDQLLDYARRRGMSAEEMRKYVR